MVAVDFGKRNDASLKENSINFKKFAELKLNNEAYSGRVTSKKKTVFLQNANTPELVAVSRTPKPESSVPKSPKIPQNAPLVVDIRQSKNTDTIGDLSTQGSRLVVRKFSKRSDSVNINSGIGLGSVNAKQRLVEIK
jgi:hypothetical protein